MRKSQLSTDAFRDYALQHFVIVEFEIPQRKAKPANHPTRLKLEGPWNINACPTTVLADARGAADAQACRRLENPNGRLPEGARQTA